VLGHEVWTGIFGADPGVIGRDVLLNRQSFTVVGVAPEGVRGVDMVPASYFVPIATQPLLRPGFDLYSDEAAIWLTLIGRRPEEARLEQVRAELGVIAAQIDRQQLPRETRLIVDHARPNSGPNDRPQTLAIGAVVMTAFGLVLLTACANVANLLLARATGRGREIAVRLSLGASRARIVQPLLAESMLLALAGGLIGSVFAIWSFQGLVVFAMSALPPEVPRLLIDTSPDWRVLAFALVVSLATGFVAGLAPALTASRPDLHTAMKSDAPVAGRRTGRRLQGALVGVQVALCMVLTIAAGLLLRGLHAAQTVEPGFGYDGVAVASFGLGGAGYDTQRAAAFQRQLMERVGSLPGMVAVAQAASTPLSPGTTRTFVGMPGEEQYALVPFNAASPNYFSLIGIPIVRGRTFTDAELVDGSPAVIVTEATARRYWPDRDPIGQTIGGNRPTPEGEIQRFEFRVVGVAKDAQISDIGEIPSSYLYFPAVPQRQPALQLLAKSRVDFATTAASIRAAAADLDPALVVRIAPLEANLDLRRNLGRLVGSLSTSLGALALVLASVGVYGVVAYAVGRRIREIAIRIALGASARSVLTLVLRRTMRPVVAGAVIGVAAAAGMSRVLVSVLFGVSPVDPLALLGAALVVASVAVVAGVVPALRAARVDPMRALHYE
jgi:predicted permease